MSLALLIGALYPPRNVEAAPSTVYFPVTGQHVSEPFLSHWRLNGDLPIYGYPLSASFERDGRTVQYFERAVFEHHPEHQGTPFVVQLELIGNELVQGRDEPAFNPLSAPSEPSSDPHRTFFTETGHSLAYGFKEYWEANGGLPVFGYPISEEFSENNRTVQYFERARFEWHPEHRGTPYEVLLGRLGAGAAVRDGVDTTPTPRQEGVPDYAPGLFRQALSIPVLMYHQFGGSGSRYQMPYWRFDEQLDWLRSNGYTTVTIDEVYDYMYGLGSLPPKPVVLTFDDGDPSQWQAAQALDARGMKGVFFVMGGGPGMADWQIRSLADRGHEIGSHSVSHPNLRLLTNDQIAYQVRESKRYLEAATGRPIKYFAYPYGEYDARVISAVQSAGYRGAVAAWGGKWWSPDTPWTEPRIEVSGVISLGGFIGLVQ